jgi:integrase
MSVQFIVSRRPGKPVTWYVYAWRGGPLVLKHVGPKKPKLGAAEHAKIAQAMADDRAIPANTFRKVVRDWCSVNPAKDQEKGSVEWNALADNTKRVWRPHVDSIEARWGKFPITIWDDPRMVAKVVKWRDERASTPRTADIGVTVLNHLLDYARLRGLVRINVATGVPTLYKGADRADIIWTEPDIVAFTARAVQDKREHVVDGLRLAAVTGLRREDLVTLTWDQVGEFAIVKKALKISRRKRRRVVIPQTPQLEAVLADLRTRYRRDGVNTVLVNSKGTPWTANSFGGSFSRLKQAAGIVHVDEDGNARDKHLHDVRGTFCTMLLVEWDLTDQEAAEIMGWSPDRVAQIRKVYVDHRRVVVALGERIAAKQIAKQSGGD